MKKFIGVMAIVNVLIIVHMITGCEEPTPGTRVEVSDGQSKLVVTIEGCEYFKCYSYCGNYSLDHKGNCKNPIHVYARKEEDEDEKVKENRETRRKK